MKRTFCLLTIAVAICLLMGPDVIGRGGRGGGGGGGRGGGGGYGGGGVAGGGGGFAAGQYSGGARPGAGTRPAAAVGPNAGPGPGTRPSPGVGTNAGPGPATRPSQGQLGNFLDIPSSPGGVGGQPGVGGGPGSNGGPAGKGPAAVADFFEQGPGPGAGTPGKGVAGAPGKGVAGKPGQASANRSLAQNRPDRVENRQQLQQQRQDRRQDVQNDLRDNHPRLDFAIEHPRWAGWRANRPYRWATAAALAGWVGYGAGGEASYYDYGENIYYQDGAVYSEGQQVGTAEQYEQAAEQIASSIPAVKDPDWMPLGVFAVTQDGQSDGPPPTMFVQLTVSKEGIIAGTFQNTASGTSQPIEGMVNKGTQRAAWLISGKTRPIMETGVFNLTKDTAPALLHFADGQTQQWLLVRLDEPKQ
jgi:hypothetical protein